MSSDFQTELRNTAGAMGIPEGVTGERTPGKSKEAPFPPHPCTHGLQNPTFLWGRFLQKTWFH